MIDILWLMADNDQLMNDLKLMTLNWWLIIDDWWLMADSWQLMIKG